MKKEVHNNNLAVILISTVVVLFLVFISNSAWTGMVSNEGCPMFESKTTYIHTFEAVSSEKGISMDMCNEDLPITSMHMDVNKELTNVRIRIDALDKMPEDLPKLYRTYKVFSMEYDIINNMLVDSTEMDFKVSIPWIQARKIFSRDMKMYVFRYGTRWVEAPTEFVKVDEEYVYYKTNVPLMQYYAIAPAVVQEEEAIPPVEDVKIEVEPETEPAVVAEVPATIEMKTGGSIMAYALTALVVLVIVLIIALKHKMSSVGNIDKSVKKMLGKRK